MSLVPPGGWDDLARRSDITEVRGEMTELRGEMAELRDEIVEVRGEMALLRAHVDAQLPRLIAANIASMIGVAGLVLAAASLAS